MQLHTVTSICLLLGSEGIIAKHLYIQNNPNLPDDDIQGKSLSNTQIISTGSALADNNI